MPETPPLVERALQLERELGERSSIRRWGGSCTCSPASGVEQLAAIELLTTPKTAAILGDSPAGQ